MIKQSLRLNKGLKKQLNFKGQKNIVNPKVLNNPSDKHKIKQYDLYHLVGERQGNVAILKLNREYKHNLLTITMIQELKRFLASYELDPTIRAIQIQGKAGNIVSKGTDYSFLIHNQQNQDFKMNEEYLRELQELAFQLSKYDKPLITNINGATHNSAAALFMNAPFTLPSKNTYLQFDDINYGMTPQMGSSYQLSRLPYNIGRYLALTGDPLKGKQVYKCGFGDKYLSNPKDFIQNLLGAHQQYDDTFTSEELYSDQYVEDQLKHDTSKDIFYEGIKQEITDKLMKTKGQAYENGKLEMAQILYKKQAVEQANNKELEFSRLGYKNQQTVNHMQEYKEQVLDKLDILNFEIVDENILKDANYNKLPLQLINRCFSANTVEEIIENLQNETEHTDFCKKTIETLQSKNKTALKLTLKLLQLGQNSTWLECLQQEFRVAAKRTQDSDFTITAEFQFKKFYNEESQNPDLATKLEDVKEQQLENYFEKDEQIEEFGLDKINDGLYPVREFYDKYPNVIRSFLNEESLHDLEKQKTQDFDIKNFLHSKNIDYLRSWTLDTPTLRSSIYAREFQQQQLQLQIQRLHHLATDQTSIENYAQKKRNYIQSNFVNENERQIRDNVNSIIGEVFEEYFDRRMQNLKKISEKAFITKKQEYFLKIRKNLFDSRLVANYDELHKESQNLFDENTPTDLRFPEKNSQTIYDAQAQIVESSPIYPLIQEIKNSNPENKKILQGLNIDESRVNQILDEISQNTKFDSIQFNTPSEFDNSKIRNFDKRIQEYNLRFGDPFEEDKNIYLDNLIQHYGNKNENISQFLQQYSTEQVREMIKKESNQQNYRIFGENLLNQLDSQKHLQEIEVKSLQQDPQNLSVRKVQKELENGVESYTKLMDLQVQSQQQQNQEQQEVQGLQRYLQNDREMKSILSIFEIENTESQSPSALNQMKARFNNILETIYQSKLEQILQQEKQQNMNTVKVTRDGKSIFNTFNASGPGGDLYMKLVDDYLDGNLQQDFHNYISSHIFFTFAAVGLQELSEIFKVLFNISKRFNLGVSEEDSVQKLKSMMQTVQNTLGVPISSGQDITNIVGFLSEATEQLCLIYLMYKDKLIFPEDKLLKISQSAKYIKERDYDDLGFANYVLTAYQEQIKNQEEQEKEQYDLYEISKTDQQQLQVFLQKEFGVSDVQQNKEIIQKVQKEINSLNSYKQERQLVQSAVLYIEKLDLITQQLIHGKDHFLPEEEKQIVENLPQILDHIDLSIQSEQWAQNKLKRYIESLFEIRYKFERQATKNQLVLFDMQLAQYLEPQYLRQQMEYELSQEISHLKMLGDIFNSLKQQKAGSNPLIEQYKQEKLENEKTVKNFDAQQKLLAFQIMQLNNKNNLENQANSQKKIPQLKKKKDKSRNDRIKNEIKKAKFKQDLNDLNEIWQINERINQEQFEVQPNVQIDTQSLYRDVLGIQDFSMNEQEQQSQNNKKLQQFQFTKEEVLIPLENISQDQNCLIKDPLREEIQNFINEMK